MIVGKLRAAVESFIRTFVPTFLGAVAVLNFETVTWDGLKIAGLSAASAALAAGVAAALRVFVPLQTDAQSVGVAGVRAPRTVGRHPLRDDNLRRDDRL